MLWVLPGVFDVRAKPLRCSKEFIRLDFPTFERPRNEISGKPSVVQWLSLKALLINSAETIFIAKVNSKKKFTKTQFTQRYLGFNGKFYGFRAEAYADSSESWSQSRATRFH